MMLLLLGTALATAVVAAEPLVPGMTFGTGIAGIPICQEPRVVVNYTLSSGSSHGVLHHFVSVHALSAPHCSTCPLEECRQTAATARSSLASLSA
jgi:hypothetical protein